ncbi:MAG: DUF6794 domain-containing protein [Betaproteobacteria bacterium]
MTQAANYMPIYDVVEDLYANLPVDDLEFLKNTPEANLIQFHFSTGMRIRNYYRLWEPGNPYVDLNDEKSPFFPDQWSQSVIEALWQKLQ